MSGAKGRLLALAIVAACAQTGRAAAATPEDAEGLFRDGRAAMSEENYESARSLFERSYALERALGTLLNLAVCEEKLGKLRAALAHLQEGLSLAGEDDARRPLIAQRISRLEARLPRVTIDPDKSIDSSVTIALDSRPLTHEDLRKVMRIDPGTHVIECAGQRGERCTTIFQVAEGKESVERPKLTPAPTSGLEALEVPGDEPYRLPIAPQQPVTDRRSVAYAIGGFSLASVVVGLIAGVGVLRQKAIVDKHCKDGACDEDGFSAAETGTTLSTISTVTTALGAAGLGVSAYVLLTTPSRAGVPTAGLSLSGSF